MLLDNAIQRFVSRLPETSAAFPAMRQVQRDGCKIEAWLKSQNRTQLGERVRASSLPQRQPTRQVPARLPGCDWSRPEMYHVKTHPAQASD